MVSDSNQDLQEMSHDLASPKSKSTVLDEQIDIALTEMERSRPGLFLAGLAAGLDIAFGPLLMVTLLALVSGEWGAPLIELAIATAYAFGFVLVVLGRTELFIEHTTLAVLPVLDDQATLRSLFRLWGLIYVGNVVGGSLFTAGLVWFVPRYDIAQPAVITEISAPFIGKGLLPLFAGAIIAGWLMGLLSWLVTAAQDTLSRVVFVTLIAAVIGVLHFPTRSPATWRFSMVSSSVPCRYPSTSSFSRLQRSETSSRFRVRCPPQIRKYPKINSGETQVMIELFRVAITRLSLGNPSGQHRCGRVR